jgi:hypothetical protein
MNFYDVHSHVIEEQSGGFLIALENEKTYKNVLSNDDVNKLEDRNRLLFAVEYVTSDYQETETKIVKYHPQRENFSIEGMTNDIAYRSPKICIVDTLNQPYWQPKDYWLLAKKFKDIQFLYAHSGGWDVMDFIRMTILEDNIWIDFSWTQEYFGWCGNGSINKNIIQTIDFALSHKRLIRKIMFGSDNPFYSQRSALDKYINLPDYEYFLKTNYLSLINRVNI